MNHRLLHCITLAIVFSPAASSAADRPNVVLIVCDDLNTEIGHLGGHPQARTPNIDRLARSGVSFRRAYSNNPICAPSRSSFLTGIYPHTSGNLFWGKWFENATLANSKTIMEHFRDNGYRVVGSGKLMHHFKRDVWDEFAHKADYGPMAYDGQQRVGHPSVPRPFRSIGAVDGSFAPLSDVPFGGTDGKGWIYGRWDETQPFRYVSDDDRSPTPDERNAQWAADRIQKFAKAGTDQPFFLAVGFIRPHTPLHVPKKYFDMFPLDALELPVIKPGDADDCHYRDVFRDEVKGLRYYTTLAKSYPTIEDGLSAFLQAYLACVAAVDDQIGVVLDAVDNSGLRDGTIIIVTSDHGWNNGQKEYLFKNSPWEESTRVPFVVRAPGVTKPGGIAEHPIALIDLYPTLVDLCNLRGDTRKNDRGRSLDGHSVRPFLENPTSRDWAGPDGALTMIYAGAKSKTGLTQADLKDPAKQHWSLRTEGWRYILYNNGAEELYDHANDPYEWTNLAEDSDLVSIKKRLKGDLLRMSGAGPRRALPAPDKEKAAHCSLGLR